MSRSSLCLAVVASSLLALPVTAQVPGAPLAQSSFTSGADGWLSVTLPYPSAVPPTVLGTFAPTWVASLGGYIRLDDPDGSQMIGMAQYWVAPAPYLGDRSAAYGGSLQFDLANSGGISAFVQEDLILVGAGLTLVHALGGVPVPAFSHFSIPLSETGWTVGGMAGPAATAQDMQSVLAALEHLYVRGEHLNGPDLEFLDNVTLFAGAPWINLGHALAGVSGPPSLVGTGTLVAGSASSLVLASARPNALAILFVSFASAPVPFKGGTLVPVPVALSVSLATNGAGAIALPFPWPAGLPAGTALHFQYAIQDPAGPQGAALSNAVKAVTP